MLLQVTNAQYISNYKLKLWFNTNEVKIVDLEATIFNDHRTIFGALRNLEYFKNFSLCFNTIAWENGLDLAPEYLYELSEAQEIALAL